MWNRGLETGSYLFSHPVCLLDYVLATKPIANSMKFTWNANFLVYFI